MKGNILSGWSSKSITPSRPVLLVGQFHPRISKYVNDPLMATALFIETEDDQAVMVSCDLVSVQGVIQDKLRDILVSRMPGFDVKKLFLNATHTHTAPNTTEGWYAPQGKEVMTPTEYADLFLKGLADAVVEAYENRRPGGVSWALSHAVVGHNRRAVYRDGSARMYGATSGDNFDHIEGYEDHSLNLLFTWDENQNLTGMVVNVPCPSQVTEGEYYVSADYWHEVRIELKKRYSEKLFILSQCSAAGDQSPHFLFYSKAEENMRKIRGVSERQEIALRIANAVDYVFPVAKSDIRNSLPFKHLVSDVSLPIRKVTQKELESAKAEYDRLMKKGQIDEKSSEYAMLRRNKGVIDRYERQGENPIYQMEMHVIRLGDIAIATNPFELYLDYGIAMKARSKALQTFVVQLAANPAGQFGAGYLPTARAVAGGGYGAEIASNMVGPEGGQVLVDETVKQINRLWD